MTLVLRSRKRWVCLAVVLGLVAGACGDDDDAESATTDPPAETTTTTVATGTDETTTVPTGSTEPAPSEPNTASFRGVTEDTIRVGVAVADFEALRALGVQNYWGDAELVYQAFFDAINAAGGVHGRMIEPYYAPFNYVVPETQDAACTQLTEDNEVFIVMAGFLSDSNLCLTELHETMVMTGGFLTADLKERSGETLWLSLDAIASVTTRALAEAAIESGRLDGKTIGIVTLGALDGGGLGEEMQAILEELGYESTLAITTAPIDDEVAGEAEIDTITQRFIADGVDFVFMLTNGGAAYDNFAAAGFEPEIADHTIEASIQGVDDATLLDGVLGVGPLPTQLAWDSADFQANCVDVVLEANPGLAAEFDAQIPSGEQQADGEANWHGPIGWACSHARLFVAIAEIAGAELTNDSFRAALDSLGSIDLPGRGLVSYRSEDKWDGNDEFFLLQYDAASETVEIIGDPITIER